MAHLVINNHSGILLYDQIQPHTLFMKKTALFSVFVALFFANHVAAQDKEEGENEKAPTVIRKDRILSVSPMQFTEDGIGTSLSYEMSLDKHNIVAFTLPAVVAFDPSNHNYDSKQDYMCYIMPGLKFYPTGSNGKVKYAIGTSLVAGAGKQTNYGYNYNYYLINSYMGQYNKYVVGVTMTNSVNFKPTEHLYLGIDFALGFTYINRYNGLNEGITGIVNGGLKIGYRF